MTELPPAVELVTIGDELILGDTVDTNAAWLGTRLAAAGIRVLRTTTVGDDIDAIRSAVRDAIRRTGVVICSGGLGPTHDDLTRPAVAGLFGYRLREDPVVLEGIRQRFLMRGLEMPELNRIQAEVPERAVVFPNPKGTAPGLAVEGPEGQVAILLPGVPAELKAIVEASVLPYLLARRSDWGQPIRSRILRTTGIPESSLAERIADFEDSIAPLTLAYLPSVIGVDLRLTSWGGLPEEDAERALDAAEAALVDRIGEYVYGRDDEDLAAVVNRMLAQRGITLALAESCTGGLVAKRITDPPGASAVLVGAVVAYANEIKESILGVKRATLIEFGAVSAETAREMVIGVRRCIGADAALSITGIAGPGGGTPEKPVGTVWIGAALGDRITTRRYIFPGGREEIRERAAQAALAMLWRMLQDDT